MVLVVIGLFWPWLGRPGLDLPGDIVIIRGGFRFYFPIMTCLVVSGIVSLIFWLLNRRVKGGVMKRTFRSAGPLGPSSSCTLTVRPSG